MNYKNRSVRKILSHKGFNFEHNSIADNSTLTKVFGLIEFENNLLDYYLTLQGTIGPRFFGGKKKQLEQILVEPELEIKK